MNELSFEEQDLIIDKLIEKYIVVNSGSASRNFLSSRSHKDCVNILEINHPIFNMVTFAHPSRDHDGWGVFEEEATIEFDSFDVVAKEYTIQELQQKYFQDILTPTHNELIMFELTQGFEWPLK